MSDTWQQVVVEKNPSTMTPTDVANLGPPPRELMPAHHKYIKLAKPSWAGVWAAIAVISILSYTTMVIAIGFETSMLASLWWPLLTIGLAVWTGKRAARARAGLRAALRDGGLRFARVVQNLQVPVGQGISKRYRYHAAFDVAGRRVPLVIMNDGMSMLQPGQLVEVVYHADHPDEIVPTFLLV